ncbi:DegT/DnrJ/EryC1/StrS aminotransferase family protein [Robiginitalea sp. SC105]|uniref:DegT/DnrJ/EryC1/StrS family aminotransferase n=1 Tax=Robiginitalea sp. SC105 TaxID=2762332 RepID=UPI00163A89A7|nr:DegT/DnrJ/EryC1/StrS family aminotransferase [Robiginitalea sp. SC105]MBC2840422.1 DegT/DnrJ/EryC1/StrS family aminotransferase [Robiginitalea sp. SC105]
MPGFELFGENEKQSVQDVLDSGVLMRYGFGPMRNGHWKAREFEVALARRMQTPHAHVVSSGTAALSVALASAGVGAGDEVILPVFTFVASFEAVLAVGAVPVLCDIDDTLTLSPEAVEEAITPRTRALMVVHMCGSMADLDALGAICRRHDLLLIEDACQAIGGSYRDKPLGSLGDAGCFSFDFVKTVTCGEGGGIITHSGEIYAKAQAYSDHGHDHIGEDRGAESHPHLGYNYRISELHAAVGLAQLARLDAFIGIQERHYRTLWQGIESLPGITGRRVPEGGRQNYSFLNFFLTGPEKAREAQKALSEAGMDGVFYWYDNNWHYHRRWEHLKELRSLGPLPPETARRTREANEREFPLSDAWMGRCLSVLVKLGWSPEETRRRAEILKNVLGELAQ